MIKIKQIDNGFILTKPNPNIEGEIELAFSFDADFDESGEKECEAIKDLLWEVLEDIKPYSKHNKWNVVVNCEKDGKIIE